jgi:hypothetical protein
LKESLKKEFDRWTTDFPLIANSNLSLNAKVTIKDNDGSPDSKGIYSIEQFIEKFDDFWNLLFNTIHESNGSLSLDEIQNSIDENIYLFSPALVGSSVYELMVLIDIKLASSHIKSYRFCFNDNQLTSLEVYG